MQPALQNHIMDQEMDCSDSPDIIEGVKSLRENGLLTDLVLVCERYRFSVHAAILSAQSPFFLRRCQAMRDNGSHEITFNCQDPCVVSAAVKFCYGIDYEEPTIDDHELMMHDFKPSEFHARVFLLACQYSIPKLCLVAARKFKEVASGIWKSTEFAEHAEEIFITLPSRFPYMSESYEPLREAIMEIAAAHAQELLLNEGSAYDRFQQVLEQSPKLTLHLAKTALAPEPDFDFSELISRSSRTSRDATKPTRYFCPSCNSVFFAQMPRRPGASYTHACRVLPRGRSDFEQDRASREERLTMKVDAWNSLRVAD
ncbi:hypothetical protein CKM354_001113600 [Cercospora kikuchii]|uniref:BTB domain-containing protein n=1 Tax=Cercospora kikuchii TaxID=84275 RepID=A0A9P3FI10_9PEZI|nr:uncharacterized protein CKM354_001113600 [Cercospora kikuchii]GIZ48061.1 hypothetical protein CKM354_001113600 [Cercospora kikuchii]